MQVGRDELQLSFLRGEGGSCAQGVGIAYRGGSAVENGKFETAAVAEALQGCERMESGDI